MGLVMLEDPIQFLSCWPAPIGLAGRQEDQELKVYEFLVMELEIKDMEIHDLEVQELELHEMEVKGSSKS